MGREKQSPAERAFSDLGDEELLTAPDVLASLREQLEDSTKRLLAAARDDSLNVSCRVHAALLLFLLDRVEAGGELARLLDEGPQAEREAVVRVLRRRLALAEHDLESAVFAAAEVREAIARALDSSDVAMRVLFAPLATEARLPGLEERLVELLGEPDVAARFVAASHLVACGDSRGVAPLRAILEDPNEARWHAGAFLFLTGKQALPDPAGRRAAEDAVAAYLRRWEGGAPVPSQQSTFAFLERASVEALATIRHLFRVSRDPLVRGECLVAAARLGAAVDELEPRQYLGDRDLAPLAATAAAGLARGSGDAALLRAVEAAARNCAASEVYRALDALLDIGGPEGEAAAERVVAKRAPGLRARLEGRKGRGPEHFLRRAYELGILATEPRPDAVRAAWEHWGERADPSDIVLHVLGTCGVCALFDPEFDELPVRHDQLVQVFAASSRGLFQPEDVRQEWNREHTDDDDADYTVFFRHGDREYRFDAENLRDYFDEESVVTAVNQALADSGCEERFVELGGVWVCGRPEAVAEFAEETGLFHR